MSSGQNSDLALNFSGITVVFAGQTPQNELQIYTWMDATLKELTGLIKEVNLALVDIKCSSSSGSAPYG